MEDILLYAGGAGAGVILYNFPKYRIYVILGLAGGFLYMNYS